MSSLPSDLFSLSLNIDFLTSLSNTVHSLSLRILKPFNLFYVTNCTHYLLLLLILTCLPLYPLKNESHRERKYAASVIIVFQPLEQGQHLIIRHSINMYCMTGFFSNTLKFLENRHHMYLSLCPEHAPQILVYMSLSK